MTYQAITSENARSFIGCEVEFNYGAMYGSERGRVIDVHESRWGTELIAKTTDGKAKSISGFSSVGIGVYLLDGRA